MTKGITGKEPDPRQVYGDIIDLPHHQSRTREHMSLYDRAAQFSPFSALSGYGDMVQEEARLTGRRIEPDETLLEELDRKLSVITRELAEGRQPAVTLTCFRPDPLKEGGEYVTISGKVKKTDPVERKLILSDRVIAIEDIIDICLHEAVQ